MEQHDATDWGRVVYRSSYQYDYDYDPYAHRNPPINTYRAPSQSSEFLGFLPFLRILLLTLILHSYLFHLSSFHIAQYWTSWFFNRALFNRPTEVPLILRPAPNGSTSPYWMTLYRMRERIQMRSSFWFWLVTWMLSVNYFQTSVSLEAVDRWLFYILCVLPLCALAVWFVREIIHTAKVLFFWTVRATVFVLHFCWLVWRPMLWVFPAGFIAWVILTSPLRMMAQEMLDASYYSMASMLYGFGDVARDMAGQPYALDEGMKVAVSRAVSGKTIMGFITR